jgi:hypothetical protein
MQMKEAAFLDRDGVINQKALDGEYVTRCGRFSSFARSYGRNCLAEPSRVLRYHRD